jgi:hypothetical protein
MSSTVTTSELGEAPPAEPVVVFSPESDASLDASETVWLSAEEFSHDRELGGWHRTKLQHAVGCNLYGLKQSRRIRRFRNDKDRVVREYIYPRWRVCLFLGFNPDGTPPQRKAPVNATRRRSRYNGDAAANRLAELTGMNADDVLSEVVKGRLQARLDPALNRFLFLDPASATRWLDRKLDRYDD